MSKELKQVIIVWTVILLFGAFSLAYGEVLKIEETDIAKIQVSRLNAQVAEMTGIINAFIKKTGCTPKDGQIICPDLAKKNEKK